MGSTLQRVHRAEALAGGIAAAVTAVALLLAQWRGVRIDFASFAGHYVMAGGLIAGAAFYRQNGRAPGIALTLASCALFILFTNAGAVLNYLLIRTGAAPIDPLLMRADAVLGFDWAIFAERMSHYSFAARALALVYQSSLAQLVLAIMVLGFTQRRVQLHRFLLCGILCSLSCLAIWAAFPSFGPAPYVVLDPLTDARLGRVVDPHYAGQLLDLLRQGPPTIDADNLLGLIAFPSMHTVMAAMAVAYTRRTFTFWPLALLNLAMIPAILVHGGHHAVDVIGGLALFAAVAFAVRRIVPDRPEPLAAPVSAVNSTPLPAAGS